MPHATKPTVDTVRVLLQSANEARDAFGDAVSALERELGVDDLAEYSDYGVDGALNLDAGELIEQVYGGEEDGGKGVSCAKCGAFVPVSRAVTSEGEGPEAGRTFYYCSRDCEERH